MNQAARGPQSRSPRIGTNTNAGYPTHRSLGPARTCDPEQVGSATEAVAGAAAGRTGSRAICAIYTVVGAPATGAGECAVGRAAARHGAATASAAHVARGLADALVVANTPQTSSGAVGTLFAPEIAATAKAAHVAIALAVVVAQTARAGTLAILSLFAALAAAPRGTALGARPAGARLPRGLAVAAEHGSG